MSFNVRLISAFAPVCLLAALLASPHAMEAQNAQQVHPITGLPLPPEEDTATPAAKPAPVVSKPTAKPVPAPKTTKKSKAKSKAAARVREKVAPAAERPAPATEEPDVAPAPAVEPKPAVEAPTVKHEARAPRLEEPVSKAATRKGRAGHPTKPAPAVEPKHEVAAEPTPVPSENTVHAIKLPPPPDEAPEAVAPAPKVTTPKTVEPKHEAPAPKVEPKHAAPKPPPQPRHDAVKPVPVTKPVEVAPEPKHEVVKPAPEPKVEAPKTVEPKVEPKHEAPAPKPVTKPTEVAPEPKHEVVKPAPEPKVEAPKTIEPKHEAPKPVEAVPAPAPKVETPKVEAPKPAHVEERKPAGKPPVAPVEAPTTKSTGSAVTAPKTVTVPSSVVPDESLPKPVTAAPAAKPAKPQPTLKPRTGNPPAMVAPPSATTTAPAPSIVTQPKAVVPGSSVVAAPKSVVPSAAPSEASAEAPAEASAPPPPPPGTLGHIIFQGAAPFTESELAPLTGLTIGTTPTDESLQIASNRLIETGLFYNVKASYETPNNIGTATFVLQPLPASQLARVSFANLVWMTPAEIDETLKLLPLYRGVVPMGGNLRMAESIQATLEGALSSRGVQATMTHTLLPPSPQHPYTTLEFRVTSPNVVLGSASLFDIPPALVNRTLKAQTEATTVPYNEGIAGTTISDILLEPARNAGYIGAKLWHVERKRRILSRTTVAVDYTARMDAGPIYTVRALNWEPTSVLSEAEFRRLAPMHVGQVPTSDAVAKTRQVITDAYYAQGYLEANIEAKQELDTKAGAAYYTYSAMSGPQYRVHSVSVQGLSADAKQDFDAVWTMKPGDVYNEVYLLNFLNTHQNIASLKGYTFTYGRTTAPDTHLVDLTLTFKK